MKTCKYCGSTSLHKRGFINNKQRYKCNSYGKRQCEIDDREKYSTKEKSLALTLCLEGNGLRRISRILSKFFDKKI
jgi:transposase-like protein